MVLSRPAAAAYVSALIDGEGGVYHYEGRAYKTVIRISMTDREPLDTAVACYERLGISTLGVRERGMTTAGRVIYVVEVLRAEAILVAAKALDLQHPRKREKLEQMAAWVRQRQAAALPQPCSACRRKAKPLRRGLCNACRLRERRRSLRAVA